MKRFVGRDGVKRLYFEASEIEEIMEHELTKAQLMPTAADCPVDIESFLERHLKGCNRASAKFFGGNRPIFCDRGLSVAMIDGRGSCR